VARSAHKLSSTYLSPSPENENPNVQSSSRDIDTFQYTSSKDAFPSSSSSSLATYPQQRQRLPGQAPAPRRPQEEEINRHSSGDWGEHSSADLHHPHNTRSREDRRNIPSSSDKGENDIPYCRNNTYDGTDNSSLVGRISPPPPPPPPPPLPLLPTEESTTATSSTVGVGSENVGSSIGSGGSSSGNNGTSGGSRRGLSLQRGAASMSSYSVATEPFPTRVPAGPYSLADTAATATATVAASVQSSYMPSLQNKPPPSDKLSKSSFVGGSGTGTGTGTRTGSGKEIGLAADADTISGASARGGAAVDPSTTDTQNDQLKAVAVPVPGDPTRVSYSSRLQQYLEVWELTQFD
jgi:hypothetical protein